MDIIEMIDKFSTYDKKIAYTYRDSTISFDTLKQKSDALSCYIIEEYKDDKTPIIVYGHKKAEMIICFLACVKAGHAYIPVDYTLPIERINNIIENSRAKLILSSEKLDNSGLTQKILDLELINEIISRYSGNNPDISFRVKSDETYYIIYTSGSTGNPKGVQITMSALASFVKWGFNLIDKCKNGNTVFLNQAPYSFDLSVMDLYLSLTSGSTLHALDKDTMANFSALFNEFENSDISIWVSTPSFAEMCLSDKKFNSELLPKLKLFLFCGEVLSNTCAKNLYQRFNRADVVNMYGPTESTVAVTAVTITNEMYESTEPLTIGYVKENCSILIADTDGNYLPEGEKGEMYIVGDSVSTGYYRNDELNKQKFSIKEIDGVKRRCYKTGDLGYFKEKLLYYSGRADSQIKLNGYRIEIEDIENNIRKIDYIKNVVVIPKNEEGKIKYLIAVVVLNRDFEEANFKIGLKIKKDLKVLIPDYMIPRKVDIIESLPMTANGKVNRKELMERIL